MKTGINGDKVWKQKSFFIVFFNRICWSHIFGNFPSSFVIYPFFPLSFWTLFWSSYVCWFVLIWGVSPGLSSKTGCFVLDFLFRPIPFSKTNHRRVAKSRFWYAQFILLKRWRRTKQKNRGLNKMSPNGNNAAAYEARPSFARYENQLHLWGAPNLELGISLDDPFSFPLPLAWLDDEFVVGLILEISDLASSQELRF